MLMIENKESAVWIYYDQEIKHISALILKSRIEYMKIQVTPKLKMWTTMSLTVNTPRRNM